MPLRSHVLLLFYIVTDPVYLCQLDSLLPGRFGKLNLQENVSEICIHLSISESPDFKPGDCPTDLALLGDKVCVNDSNCSGNSKCCSNICAQPGNIASIQCTVMLAKSDSYVMFVYIVIRDL